MLYTIGYQSSTVDDLVRYIIKLDAILVDIRFKPYSRQREFNRDALKRRIGDYYWHVPELGNANYRGGPMWINDYETGKQRVAAALKNDPPKPVILMCMCGNLKQCHRLPVAERLARELEVGLIHLPSRYSQFIKELAEEAQESLF